MSMEGPGDHPLSDLIHYGYNPFPPDIADMLLKLHSFDPKIPDLFGLDAYDWAAGRALDEGRAKLRAELQKHQPKKP